MCMHTYTIFFTVENNLEASRFSIISYIITVQLSKSGKLKLHSLYSNSNNCPNNVLYILFSFCPGSNPESYVTYSYVFLVSFNLKHFSVIAILDLDVFKNTGHLLRRISLSLGLSDVLPQLDSAYAFLPRISQKMKLYPSQRILLGST